MAMRGEFLYTGYLPGKGMVRVHQDMDTPLYVHAVLSNGQSVFTTRDRIHARKSISKPAQTLTAPIQPTLF